MEEYGPNSKELVVKAQYFIPIDPEEERLKGIQRRIKQMLMQEGYQQTDIDPDIFGPAQRTMDFQFIPPATEKSTLEKILDKFTRSSDQGVNHDEFLGRLERVRDDLPFRLTFRFKTFQGEENEGYDVFVESVPVLLQKYRQLGLPEDYSYNKENIVDQNSREIQRIMGRFELEPIRGPYTEAQMLDSTISEGVSEELNSHEYGKTALQYVNEGDQCLQQNLLHAALSCYVLAIEWVIIHYKATEEGEDVVEEQQGGKRGPVYFSDLVDELDETVVSQKTAGKLGDINSTERRWMAHHKNGELKQTDVENVRSTLLRLSEELHK